MNTAELKASIDIGTNSVLLLVAKIQDGDIEVLEEKHAVPRLGKGVDVDKNLHPDSCDRVVNVLKSYKAHLVENYPSVVKDVVVTATSAVRDSSNRGEFLNQIYQETGWSVQLLSGEEEAQTTYSGAISVLKDQSGNFVVLDIGGGSTEIAMGNRLELSSGVSIDMGSVRFSERYLKNDPPTADELETLRDEVKRLLKAKNFNLKNYRLVGVAGTVTSIAAIELGLEEYDASLINGYHLKKESVENFIDEFSRINSDKIEHKYSPFLTGRGDVITGGLIILHEFMNHFKFDELIVSTGGIRHGILTK
ncbi:Ppx/GppA phosphatase family protein [Rhodohalobacter sp.]|uniref:Ppx/GppA phosphatase family protein n=1 Tax=Rhodohalobacter sp. TaxID=1974210 RepID=UPI002ACDC7F9|nr:Ppx/GppA phosphatase family protein [Rhodohalobacter sp.]